MQTILAIDDEASVRTSFKAILDGDYHVLLAESGQRGLELLAERHVDLLLLDLRMPGMTGEQVLAHLREEGNTVPVIVVTASDSVTLAVEAMKLGARDYVVKPFDVDAIVHVIQRVLTSEQEKLELKILREADLNGFESIIGASPTLLDTLKMARQAMNVDSTVLVTGENGTGKDLLARAIHSGGKRKDRAFVALSCCAIPAQLIESELFGYEKGAFTGADERRVGKLQVADEGTLFLDEIGEMPIEAQVKLLRVLQDGCFFPVGSLKEIEVDIRIISATNRDLPQAIKSGIFREDLYYRLNVLHIEMPPLRRRREDIPSLVTHFMAKHAPRVNARTTSVAPKAMSRLVAHDWPGNIRELQNTVERLLVYYGQEAVITADHVEALLPKATQDRYDDISVEEYEGLPLDEATRMIERRLILRALDRSDNVITRAAEILGTTRRILKYKMDQLDLTPH